MERSSCRNLANSISEAIMLREMATPPGHFIALQAFNIPQEILLRYGPFFCFPNCYYAAVHLKKKQKQNKRWSCIILHPF